MAAFSGTRVSYIKNNNLKPFNSLLGETYELVTGKYRLIAEQVSHHPPVTAYHCESNYYEIYSCQCNTGRFNGRYISLISTNRNYINLKLPNGELEQYSWTVPNCAIHNLVIGKLYVEMRGKSQIFNHTTGDVCDIEWKERGWSGKPDRLTGIVKSTAGEPMYRMQGTFTEAMSICDLTDPNAQEEEVFRMNPKSTNYESMYYFSDFVLQVNYVTPELKERLPPTDTRLRPDQRALENGETETAIKEKHRLEENQRARRKQFEKSGTEHVPVYFAQE